MSPMATRRATIGLALLAAALVAVLQDSVLWWPAVVTGLLLFLGAINEGRPESLWSWPMPSRRLLTLYALFALVGIGQEVIGRLTGIWTYQGAYATTVGTAFLIIAGYPLFLAATAESFVVFKYSVRPAWLAWAGSIIFLTAWSELPNRLAALYVVNDPFEQYRSLVFGIGYAIQMAVAVGLRRWLGRGDG